MNFLTFLNEQITLFIVFPAVLLLGLYLTIKLRGVQISRLKMSFNELLRSKDQQGEGNISHYQAIASVLAGNFGTGNISGMAVALTIGGPGALFWMWVIALLGASLQYASCVLGVLFRTKNAKGEYVGGPMYYLRDGANRKKTAILFSFIVIIAAMSCGNFVQVNSIALPLANIGIPPWITAILATFFVGLVLIGGSQRVAVVASGVVPIMAGLYLGGALIILGIHIEKIPEAFLMILASAFGKGTALLGGAAGFGIARVVVSGFDRAIFATDAGTGLVPILQSGARTRHPVVDGVVTLVAPLFVMIVCTTTALVLIVTGVWQNGELTSTNMVTAAFQSVFGEFFGIWIVALALVLFGYTTILAWGSCALRAIEFLFGKRGVLFMQLLFIATVPIGAFMQTHLAWILADIALSSMLLINLFGVVLLRKQVAATTREFFFAKIGPSLK